MGETKDLTRIEDLQEFLHQDDKETEQILASEDSGPKDSSFEEMPYSANIDNELENQEDNFSFSEESQSFQNNDNFEEEEISHDLEDNFSPSEESQSFQNNDNFEEESYDDIEDSEKDDFQEKKVENSEPNRPSSDMAEEEKIQERSFREIRNFAKSISYGKITLEGNPPYTLLLKNLKFQEDIESIWEILNEHQIITEDNHKLFKDSLKNGTLFLSHLSEFSAVYLAQKLRRFQGDIFVGLSEELGPGTTEQNFRGLVTDKNIEQNFSKLEIMNDEKVKKEDILVTTLPNLEGHKVYKYIDVISEEKMLDSYELDQIFYKSHPYPEKDLLNLSEEEKEVLQEIEEIKSRLKNQSEQLAVSENLSIYKELINNLKEKAERLNANAVIDISFQITAIEQTNIDESFLKQYQMICTGSAVWAQKI